MTRPRTRHGKFMIMSPEGELGATLQGAAPAEYVIHVEPDLLHLILYFTLSPAHTSGRPRRGPFFLFSDSAFKFWGPISGFPDSGFRFLVFRSKIHVFASSFGFLDAGFKWLVRFLGLGIQDSSFCVQF